MNHYSTIAQSAATFSPARCHIDLAAIGRNFARLGPASRLMPVIKSDAYGHGLLPVARTLSKAGARKFAVGLAEEGLALRQAGLSQGIVTLLPTLDDAGLDACRAHDIVVAVGDAEQLERCAVHGDADRPLSIAIQCETGMGRLGFDSADLPLLTDRLRGMPGVRPVLALSHLACADMPEECEYTTGQVRAFAAMTDVLRHAFPDMERSLANTAGILESHGLPYEWDRPGLALYGGNPLEAVPGAATPGLEWAMSVSAPVLAVRTLAAGQSVSYGRTFTASRTTKLAVVGIGYATALARALSNRVHMLVNGRRVPQIGRICMGLTMLDISHAGPVRVGDLAWVLGGQAAVGERPVTPQELADTLGTIPYEVLCLMGGMISREWSD
ncbi:MAG: alanine racemase [Desulfovibrio sp.]|nr:alanine racemase [Desulfovibrio sp.]